MEDDSDRASEEWWGLRYAWAAAMRDFGPQSPEAEAARTAFVVCDERRLSA